jgi:hypothetical protein
VKNIGVHRQGAGFNRVEDALRARGVGRCAEGLIKKEQAM